MGGILLDCLILMPLLLWWRMVWEEWWLHSLAWRRTGSTQPQYMYSIMEEWYSSHNQWRSVSVCCVYRVSHYSIVFPKAFTMCKIWPFHLMTVDSCVSLSYYVRRSKSPWSVMKPECSSESHCCYHQHTMINGADQCFNNLPASGSCNISVTDLDAVGNINATLAVKYIDVIVVGPSSTTDSVHHTATIYHITWYWHGNYDTVLPTEIPTGLWLYIWPS